MARTIGAIVRGFSPDGQLKEAGPLVTALMQYAYVIEPWARSVANLMMADVARRDHKMWRANSKAMATELRRTLATGQVAEAYAGLQEAQVNLIKSIPIEAAKRVHDLTQEGLITSKRASTVAAEILRTQDVSAARARLIARTETSRAASNLVQVRAVKAGSQGYIWRTSEDADVRDSHREMEGVYVRWSSPPTLDGLKGHAGTLPNCRCFAEPIFPDD